MTLRTYQAEGVEASLRYLRNGGDRGVLIAPTGSGKSHIIAEIVRNLDGDAVVFQPSREILEQNAAKLAAAGCRPAIHLASLGRREVGRVTLATIGSVRKTPELFRTCRYVLVDECHLVNPKKGMYRAFLEELRKVKILGLTATPYRLASNSWGSELRFITRTRPRVFRDVVHHTQIGDLLRQGFLSPLRYREIPTIDLARLEVNSTGADYTDEIRAKGYSRAASAWEADHVVPVGEGGCGLQGYRTLCRPCHVRVTADLRTRLATKARPACLRELGDPEQIVLPLAGGRLW